MTILIFYIRLPEEILSAYDEYIKEMNEAEMGQPEPFYIRKKRLRHKGQLSTILQMSCYGYNSGYFDYSLSCFENLDLRSVRYSMLTSWYDEMDIKK